MSPSPPPAPPPHGRRPPPGGAAPAGAPAPAPAPESPILEGLNPEQRAAVTATEGPLQVIAGAGSGKTRVLVHRVAYLIGVCGVAAEQILAVTFTNRAAAEMRERVAGLLGADAKGAWIETFHAACVRILRRDIGHLGLSRGFAIYDDADSLATVKEAIARRGLDPRRYEPRGLRWRIDQWKNAGVLPDRAMQGALDAQAEEAAKLYAAYQRLLRDREALDFGDLILQTTELFARFPDVLDHYRRRWHYILIDEYQDTNAVQYRLVHQLAAKHHNLCVVGDPNQSIYAWRGADIRNILDFERDYPGAAVVTLNRNYRSRRPILDAASAVVAHNPTRRRVAMRAERGEGDRVRGHEALDEREEARFVVGELRAGLAAGRPARDFTVIYRTNAQSRPFEEELLLHDVAYTVVGGLRFYARAEIKDALAYLRLLASPGDRVAALRAINRPPRGIGPTTVQRGDTIAEAEGISLLEGLGALAARRQAGRSAAPILRFLDLLDAWRRDAADLPIHQLLHRVLEGSGYVAHLEREESAEAEARVENLRELLSAAEDFAASDAALADPDRSPLELFLDQVALVQDADSYEGQVDRVSLMTAHTAKGLEFPVIFLVGLEEGLLPHAASIGDAAALEEERRLCYVGMTRAMERLYLCWARTRRRFGTRNFSEPSRFLSEIPAEVLEGAGGWDAGPGAGAGGRGRSAAPGDRTLDYSYADSGEPAEFRAGLRVRHPIFGTGTVQQVRGEGRSQKLLIDFDRVGHKTIVPHRARLEPA